VGGVGSGEHGGPGVLLRTPDAVPDAGQLQSEDRPPGLEDCLPGLEDRAPGLAASLLAQLTSLQLVMHRLSTLLQSLLLPPGTADDSS